MSSSLRAILLLGILAVVVLALLSWYFVSSQPKLQSMVALKRQLGESLGHERARLARITGGDGRPGLKVIVPLDRWPAERAARRKLQQDVGLFVRQQYDGADREKLRFVQVDLVADLGSGCSSRPVMDSKQFPFEMKPGRFGRQPRLKIKQSRPLERTRQGKSKR